MATAVEADGIDREIGGLKAQIGKMLADISERLATESTGCRSIQKAVESKEQELKELYGIEKAAVSLGSVEDGPTSKRID